MGNETLNALRTAILDCLATCRFETPSGRILTASDTKRLRDEDHPDARVAKVVDTSDGVEALAQTIIAQTPGYVNNDGNLGAGVWHVLDKKEPLAPRDMAAGIARAAAMCGVDSVADLVHNWTAGAKITYERHRILRGATAQTPLISQGFRLEPGQMTDAASEAIGGLLRLVFDEPPLVELMKVAVNAVEATRLIVKNDTFPGFYRFANHDGRSGLPQTVKERDQNEDNNAETLCYALSLVKNSCIRWVYAWNEIGILKEFAAGSVGMFRVNHNIESLNAYTGDDTVILVDADLAEAGLLYSQMGRTLPNDPGLKAALTFWRRAIRPEGEFPEKVASLRAALECLFVGRGNTELSHRLAMNGAWYTSTSTNERKRTYKMLKDAYNNASKIVHGVQDVPTDAKMQNLVQAAALCRRAIRKRIENGEKPDLLAVSLGDDSTT